MNLSEVSIDELVSAAYKAHPEPAPDEHPSPVELLAYHTDELSPDDEERVRVHLVECAECSRTLLDLADFPDVELRDPRLRRSADEAAEDWRHLEARLNEAPSAPVRVRTRIPPWATALAAVLAACVFGLLAWSLSLQRELEAARAPRANVYSKDLRPVDTTVRRSDAPGDRFEVPAGMEYLLLFLDGAGSERFADYRVELVDPDGSVTWSRSGLHRAPEGNFSVELPRSLVAAGRYEIRLYGIGPSEPSLMATYRVTLTLD